MRSAITTILFAAVAAMPLGAQGRGGDDRGGIPPGHLPPPGQCKVWYDGRTPGQQPPPTSCDEAERTAARDRRARVVYGVESGRDRDDRGRDERDRDRDERNRDRDERDREGGWTLPRVPVPGESRNPRDRFPERTGTRSVAFDNGYKDGYDKGREDARDNDSHDPVRHVWYRNADRGYNSRYGSREEYKDLYREGFRDGYDQGYRDVEVYGDDRNGGFRLPWPF